MDIIQNLFRRRKVSVSALEPFGFQRADTGYVYKRALPGCGFHMTVTVAPGGAVSAEIIDPGSREAYTLHLADGAAGSFVGGVRAEYEAVLTEISEKCFVPDVFKSAQARDIIDHVRATYGDELEFLWEKFPDNAVWRRRDTAKWYGALLTVSRRKLGFKSDETAEIIDLRAAPESMGALIDNKIYLPGWHMNKKNWYTIVLDGSVSADELYRRLGESYALATK